MAINVEDYLSWIKRDWMNEPFVKENWLAISIASAIIGIILVIWIVWKIIKYIDGRKVRDYHSNGPLDKMIDKRIEDLASRR